MIFYERYDEYTDYDEDGDRSGLSPTKQLSALSRRSSFRELSNDEKPSNERRKEMQDLPTNYELQEITDPQIVEEIRE